MSHVVTTRGGVTNGTSLSHESRLPLLALSRPIRLCMTSPPIPSLKRYCKKQNRQTPPFAAASFPGARLLDHGGCSDTASPWA